MSKAKTRWKRFLGLPEKRWKGRDPTRPPLPEDCNTVVTPSALREAGVTNVTRGKLKLERDPRFHHKVVIFPDGRRETTTDQTSLSWLAGAQRDEACTRSLANLMVGDQVLKTTVTKPQGSWGPPFVPEVYVIPVTPPAPTASLREARAPADRAVAVVRNDRDLDSALLDLLCSDALRLLNATDAPLRRGDLAAELGLEHSKEDRLVLAKVIYRLKTEGYHVAP